MILTADSSDSRRSLRRIHCRWGRSDVGQPILFEQWAAAGFQRAFFILLRAELHSRFIKLAA
jgi:hypothetical protein